MRLTSIGLVATVLSLSGCTSKPPEASTNPAPAGSSKADPAAVALIKKSMDSYASLDSARIEYKWTTRVKPIGGEERTLTSQRTLLYQKPNKFKIVSSVPEVGFTMTTVSDGSKMVEYASDKRMPAHTTDGPTSIAEAKGAQMLNPMFSGTIIYQWIGGSSNYERVVDEKRLAPSLGSKEKSATGEDAQTVDFYAKSTYGHVKALIGLETGTVYRIEFDNSALKDLAQNMSDADKQGKTPPDMTTIEEFAVLKKGADIDPKSFDTTVPASAGAEPQMAEAPSDAPFPLGKPAPNFTVVTLDGKTVSLSSLKGHVVLIDFWATWCGPCKEGLPVTDKLSQELSGKGVKVLAVSAEDRATIQAFVQQNGYKFAACVDAGGKANLAYKVQGIPTTVIIDKNGNLSSYKVGLRPEAEVRSDLKKAGI